MMKQTISEALEAIGYTVVFGDEGVREIYECGEKIGLLDPEWGPFMLDNVSDKQYRQVNHLYRRMLEGRLVYG